MRAGAGLLCRTDRAHRNDPEAQSEYAGYSGTLGRLLREGASADELTTFLGDAETHMGLAPNKDRDRLVATKLIDWYRDAMLGP